MKCPKCKKGEMLMFFSGGSSSCPMDVWYEKIVTHLSYTDILYPIKHIAKHYKDHHVDYDLFLEDKIKSAVTNKITYPVYSGALNLSFTLDCVALYDL